LKTSCERKMEKFGTMRFESIFHRALSFCRMCLAFDCIKSNSVQRFFWAAGRWNVGRRKARNWSRSWQRIDVVLADAEDDTAGEKKAAA